MILQAGIDLAGNPVMKIAQVAPLYESVPPKYYGGTERVVSYLTEELVRQGHDVTLFASGDSVTRAHLAPACPSGLRLNKHCVDQMAYHIGMLEMVFSRAEEFDVVHFHIDYMHFPFSKRQPMASLTTLHGRLDLPDLVPLYRQFPDIPVVSISNAQRKPLPWINWQSTVYHGLPDVYDFQPGGKYLAFLGRISPEKRLDRAIEIARRAGLEIKIAAKVAKSDQDYFKEIIKPMLKDPRVDYLGEIGEREKNRLLGGALALLFPIDWPEPFGMVMIEAMACGTPVIAYPHGSTPEVIDDGVTGFLVNRIDDAVAAVERASSLSRSRCREVFEQRFSADRMVRDYVTAYRRLLVGVGEPSLTSAA
jgi:glycosyltransferase involved in cell wall biosynthesis